MGQQLRCRVVMGSLLSLLIAVPASAASITFLTGSDDLRWRWVDVRMVLVRQSTDPIITGVQADLLFDSTQLDFIGSCEDHTECRRDADCRIGNCLPYCEGASLGDVSVSLPLEPTDPLPTKRLRLAVLASQNPATTYETGDMIQCFFQDKRDESLDQPLHLSADRAFVSDLDGHLIPVMADIDPPRIVLALSQSRDFSYGLTSGFGFCPELHELYSADIHADGNGDMRFAASKIEATRGDCTWSVPPDDCFVGISTLVERPLTAAEGEQVRIAFSAVAVSTESICCFDLCSIRNFTWNALHLTDDKGRRWSVEWPQARQLHALLNDLSSRSLVVGCHGDCNGDGLVTITDLTIAVRLALGEESVTSCATVDANNDGMVAVNEIVAAVWFALNDGCLTWERAPY